MIDPIKSRYPDPPPKPTAWHGWRRKKGSDRAMVRVEGAEGDTKGECYQKLMELSELVGTAEPVEWQYAIVPAGMKPIPPYRHRMLRPQ